jgi:hypothetical protein
MKKSVLFLLALSVSNLLLAKSNFFNVSIGDKAVESTVGLGSVLAIVTSWERNKSILWAIVHAIFGWAYVIYYVLTREEKH